MKAWEILQKTRASGERGEHMTTLRYTFSLAATLSLLSGCAKDASQRPSDGAHAGASTTAAAPTRTTPFGNLGAYHRAIKTANADAQKFFDEGLTLLYGFNHEEAFRSFQRSASHDADSPMPHWGMALALGTNINDPAPAERLKKAHVHLAEAVKRVGNGSEVEQGLVRALSERYVADAAGDQAPREEAYSRAMEALAKNFATDPDVATLYAESMMNLHPWRLYKSDGSPEAWTPAIVSALEGVLAHNEQHPGANHYYIHAVEASKAPERAAPSASRLETLVPGAGHLVHMPAHIYIRTGRFAEAAKQNAEAAAVDEAYFKAEGPQPFYSMAYYLHNLQFESAAAMFAGNYAEAQRTARRTSENAEPIADQMAMLEAFAAQELLVLVRFAKWDAILAAKAPVPERTVLSGLSHWARGVALAETKKVTEAERALAQLKAGATRVPKEAFVGPINWGGDVLAVAVADLEGRVRRASGDLKGAIAAFTRAVAAEDRLGYNEPPDWLLPEREQLGATLLSAGRASDAERVFRDDLVKHVGSPWALHGVWRSLEAMKSPNAAAAKQAFEDAWKGADVALGANFVPTPK
jgi:hypothetical protein